MSKIKTTTITLLVILGILCIVFFINKTSEKPHIQKCPDEYGTTTAETTQYQIDFDKWTNNFYDSHHGATLSDWSKARYQFWIENGCTEAIQRYNEAKDGKADPVIMNEIKDNIQESIK
ncbi:MAG: hypothetical protein NTU76_03775 [Candidatus Taylorbacteria bacterium]|nr:hypothetical protein [Candidatus Taylorbacteria bacterium]